MAEFLYRDRCLYTRMRIVALDLEIFETVIKQGFRFAFDDQFRQCARLARKLQMCLLKMVAVEVRIAAGPHETADVKVALLGHHMHQ